MEARNALAITVLPAEMLQLSVKCRSYRFAQKQKARRNAKKKSGEASCKAMQKAAGKAPKSSHQSTSKGQTQVKPKNSVVGLGECLEASRCGT